jgi:hypothetical protein
MSLLFSNNSAFIQKCIQNAKLSTCADQEQITETSQDSYDENSLFNYANPNEEYDSDHSSLSSTTGYDYSNQPLNNMEYTELDNKKPHAVLLLQPQHLLKHQ